MRVGRLGLSMGSGLRELGRSVAVGEQIMQCFQARLFLIILETLTDFENLFLHCGLHWISLHKSRLESLNLGVEQAEGTRIGNFQTGKGIRRQLLVGLPQFNHPMRIRTVFAEVACLVLLIVLANLRFIVIVRDVEHFVLDF